MHCEIGQNPKKSPRKSEEQKFHAENFPPLVEKEKEVTTSNQALTIYFCLRLRNKNQLYNTVRQNKIRLKELLKMKFI